MAFPRIPDAADLASANCSCGEDCCGGDGTEANGAGRSSAYVDPTTFTTGRIEGPEGSVSVVATRLGPRDRRGARLVRLGIGRSGYAIAPGLYAAGTPDPWSPVLLTANYKLSFDVLRSAFDGLSAWILVLDTRGINVWCAAGKGTFGTEEIVRKIGQTGLARIVRHRTLILPQLGAPGVAAHEVARRSGFRVVYGPVRASDLRPFLAGGMKASPGMRRVRFGFGDRLALVPVELVSIARNRIFLAALVLGLAARVAGIRGAGLAVIAGLGAVVIGAAAVPAFLPWIPGRAFALKGWIAGLAWAAAVALARGFPPASLSAASAAVSWLLLLPPLSAFLAMNFTGSSTFTSLTGVVTEMKIAIPAMALSALAGILAAAASVLLPG